MKFNNKRRMKGEEARQAARHQTVKRREGVTTGRSTVRDKEVDARKQTLYAADEVMIKLENVRYMYASQAWDQLSCGIENASLEFSQGKLVALVGRPAEGKSTLLKLISGVLLPDSGNLLIPPHLRVLHISQEPLFFHDTLFANLTYGVNSADLMDCQDRAWEICRRLTLPDRVLDYLDFNSEEQSEQVKLIAEWGELLSLTQKMLLNLSRAFIANPEVLVCHKPTLTFDTDLADNTLELLREFCDEKGLEMDPDMIEFRRPRTCIITTTRSQGVNVADHVFRVEPQGVTEIPRTERSSITAELLM